MTIGKVTQSYTAQIRDESKSILHPASRTPNITSNKSLPTHIKLALYQKTPSKDRTLTTRNPVW
ncbi:hypothetical protein BTUL_0089g00120 [Botrytis tulipae]|uniref:Uncharacterized protein n=1 Tax=Botrytis tulipae TaxID=87230 RepID=A0A4Z1EJ06_9HELO|nr:hypothetical protein BTUL_0089g00120 [Botrytis tulipae]